MVINIPFWEVESVINLLWTNLVSRLRKVRTSVLLSWEVTEGVIQHDKDEAWSKLVTLGTDGNTFRKSFSELTRLLTTAPAWSFVISNFTEVFIWNYCL